MLVKRKKLFDAVIFGIILLLITVWSYPSCLALKHGWEKQIAILSLILFVYIIYIWHNHKLEWLTPTFVFTMAVYVLHLALVILVGFNLKEYPVRQNVVLYSYSEEDAPFALVYSVWFIYVLATSIMMMKKEYYTSTELLDYEPYKYKQARSMGWILFVISFPAMVVNLVQLVHIRMTISYHDIYNTQTTLFGIPLGPMMNLFVPAIFYLLFSYSCSKKKFLITSYFVLAYYGLYMIFTGAKINALIMCISILIMYNQYFGLKIGLKMVLMGYLGAKVLVAVSGLRSDEGLGNISNTLALFINNFVYEDPIITLLNELGGTILTPILVMFAVRSGGGLLYGQSYIFGPIGSILSGLRITDYFKNKADMVSYLTDPARGSYINSKTYAMGGSVIGEWFLNFGWFGLILVPILAYALFCFEKKLFKKNQSPFVVVIMYSTLISVLMYARQYITDIFWIAFYRLVVCYVLEWLLFRRTKKV